MKYLLYDTKININKLPNVLEHSVTISADKEVNLALTFLSTPRPAFIYEKPSGAGRRQIMALQQNTYRFFNNKQYGLTYNQDGIISLVVKRDEN